MPVDNPYPSAPVSVSEEAVVSFTVKELLEQISRKLDNMTVNYDARLAMLERNPAPIVNGEIRMTTVEQHAAAHELRLTAVEKSDTLQAGGVMFKDKIYAKLVGLAGVMGVVAGITFQILQAVS